MSARKSKLSKSNDARSIGSETLGNGESGGHGRLERSINDKCMKSD